MSQTLAQLKKVLAENADKKITVLGTTCIGKTTLLKEIPAGIAISDLAPPLTSEEEDFYYRAPLTRENNKKMAAMRAGRALVKAEQPVFGTAVAQGTELIVYLKISDGLLKERTASRQVDFQDAKTMDQFIKEEIKESGLPVIEIDVVD